MTLKVPEPCLAETAQDFPDKTARFEILGCNRPARFSLTGLVEEDGDCECRAALFYSDLAASSKVCGLDVAKFLTYFEDLAESRNGWVGEKCAANLDGELSIGCDYQEVRQPPEVWFYVRLALDHSDPYWTVQLRLVVQPDALQDLAEQARRFFRAPA